MRCTISGLYTVFVGGSSQSLPLRATFEVNAKQPPAVGLGSTVYQYGQTVYQYGQKE